MNSHEKETINQINVNVTYLSGCCLLFFVTFNSFSCFCSPARKDEKSDNVAENCSRNVGNCGTHLKIVVRNFHIVGTHWNCCEQCTLGQFVVRDVAGVDVAVLPYFYNIAQHFQRWNHSAFQTCPIPRAMSHPLSAPSLFSSMYHRTLKRLRCFARLAFYVEWWTMNLKPNRHSQIKLWHFIISQIYPQAPVSTSLNARWSDQSKLLLSTSVHWLKHCSVQPYITSL